MQEPGESGSSSFSWRSYAAQRCSLPQAARKKPTSPESAAPIMSSAIGTPTSGKVMKITAGKGVDVVYDAVGKDTIAGSIRSLKKRGLCINYGGASGLVESVNPLELGEAGSVFFTRPHLADYLQTAEELGSRAADLFAAHAAGKLRVTIDREFPLEQAAEAHRYIESGKTKGKLLLRI